MVNSISSEFQSFILWFVQTDNMHHSKVFEYLQVVFWTVTSLLSTGGSVNRSHECYELVGNNPVKIAVLDFLIIFIFFVVKILEFIPTVTNSYL
jgi:hypothetical protein